jgi:type 1 glutamine amidotransferase
MMCKRWLSAVGVWVVLAAVAAAADAPLKALIVDGQNAHNWKATTPVLKKILEDSGMFQVDVATSPAKGMDMSGFRPKFAGYAVVVSNYQGDDWPDETKKDLVDYVRNGGGLVVYHFACAAFPKWKEYNDMIGVGGWGGRTVKSGPFVRWRDGKMVLDPAPDDKHAGAHGPAQPFQVVVRDPDHPITKGLPEKFAHPTDELYGWLRGPAKNLTVLATAFAPKEKGGSDENEPILFTIQYGKGRVIQNALGHTAEQLKAVSFIVTFLRGCEWAATGKVTQKVPDDFPSPDKPSIRE